MQKTLFGVRKVISSCFVAVATMFLNAVFCVFANFLLQIWFIPTLCRFSYDMHLYFESFETIPEPLGNAVIFVSSVIGLLPAAAIAVRWSKARQEFFIKETNGLIPHREGLRFYGKHYGIFDAIASVLTSSVATIWFLAKERWFFPLGYTLHAAFGVVGGWVATALALTLAFAAGTFFAQRHWRASQLLGRLD